METKLSQPPFFATTKEGKQSVQCSGGGGESGGGVRPNSGHVSKNEEKNFRKPSKLSRKKSLHNLYFLQKKKKEKS